MSPIIGSEQAEVFNHVLRLFEERKDQGGAEVELPRVTAGDDVNIGENGYSRWGVDGSFESCAWTAFGERDLALLGLLITSLNQ